jgi:Tfp pilus assembly protein PilV
MLNKKGTTLAEVVISIVLISVVLVFMIKLLIDLNNTEANNEYAKSNQITRAEIIRVIENDLRSKSISSITDGSPNKDNLIINFNFKDNTSAQINCTSNRITYTSSQNDIRSWTMDEGSIYTSAAQIYWGISPNNLYVITIDIEIHTPNDNNSAYVYQNTEDGRRMVASNNTIDDFIISYVGKLDDGFSQNCLGKTCQNG